MTGAYAAYARIDAALASDAMTGPSASTRSSSRSN